MPDPENVAMTFNFDPTNPTHEAARLGFMAMSDQLGIMYDRSLQSLAAEDMLPEDYLIATSAKIYDTDLYGQNAAVALKFLTTDPMNRVKTWPEQPTYRDLRTFMQQREYSRHGLHGNLGRTLNVLLASVDLTYPITRDTDIERLSIEGLEARLRETFSQDGPRKFQQHVSTILKTQLRTGKPASEGELLGELLIGGRLLEKKGARLTCEQVEREGLAVIANAYGSKRQVAKWLEETSHYNHDSGSEPAI